MIEPRNAEFSEKDYEYMHRALLLAAGGRGRVSPNPMVGAVIVAAGRIIGEGYHRKFGEAHAEVNAVRSVRPEDRHLLKESTIYVTLEPCSHYGKTPPCAELLIREGIPRIVIAATDPFEKVSGRGVAMLREAGREVITGVLAEEAEELNVRFMTAHRLGRPFVELKWARTPDGFMAAYNKEGNKIPVAISDPLTKRLMHRERAASDAIMAGTGTILSDNPALTLRLWPGRDPLRIILRGKREIPEESSVLADGNYLFVEPGESLDKVLNMLYREHGVTSLLVEGGPALLQSFIDAGLWDMARIEIGNQLLYTGLPGPQLKDACLMESRHHRDNIINIYRRI